jgi:hypothetical protein
MASTISTREYPHCLPIILLFLSIISLTHLLSDCGPALWEIECSFQPESLKNFKKYLYFFFFYLIAMIHDLHAIHKKKNTLFDLAIGSP